MAKEWSALAMVFSERRLQELLAISKSLITLFKISADLGFVEKFQFEPLITGNALSVERVSISI